MGPGRSSFRFARIAAVGLLVVLGLAIAFLAGRGSDKAAAPVAPVGSENASDTAHTPAGAVAAYLEQQAQLADPELWVSSDAHRAKALQAILASTELRRSIKRSMDIAVRGGDPLGRALRSRDPVLARSAPLGFRLISYSRRRAVLEAWIFSLLGGEGIPLDLRLVRYRAVELWDGGAWRLTQTRNVGEGSAVRFRGAPDLSATLAASLGDFRTVEHEP